MGDGTINKEELNKKAERVVGGNQPAPAPGKSTLKIDEDPSKSIHPSTGNEYIDKEGVTSSGPNSDLLTSKQRDLLVNNFQQRVLEASGAYKAALMQVRMDKLFEKPEDMSWILTLALGAVGWYGGVMLGRALSDMLKSGAEGVVKRFVEADTSARVSKIGARVFEQLTNAQAAMPSKISRVGKVYEKQIAAAGANVAKGHAKKDIDFIGILGDQSGVLFSRIRENQMMGLNDIELIGLHDSWDPIHHTISNYVDEIKREIQLYNKSEIQNVGRFKFNSMVDGPNKDPGESQAALAWTGRTATIDRFVVRLAFMSGYGPRYAIADKYVDLPDYPVSPPAKDDDGRLHEGKVNGNTMKYLYEKYSIIKLVEPELVETALAKHVATWGADPKILIINDVARNREQGPMPYKQKMPEPDKKMPDFTAPAIGVSGGYNIEETKDLNYNDPKTWRYTNNKVSS